MAAAEKLFLAKGVEATTISEIVEEAQVAKGTFYHYFASKNEMLTALGGRYTAQFLERLQDAVDACPANDWRTRLQTWIRVNVEAYVETYRTHDIVYTNHHHHDRSNQDKNAILDQLLDIIENGIAAGTWTADQPRVVALLIYSGVHGATDDIIAARPADCAAFAQAVADNCMRMLDAPGAAAPRLQAPGQGALNAGPRPGAHRAMPERRRARAHGSAGMAAWMAQAQRLQARVMARIPRPARHEDPLAVVPQIGLRASGGRTDGRQAQRPQQRRRAPPPSHSIWPNGASIKAG